ncbi:hypothetical protein ATANTOWER_004654 [Ataeniobius toweri]|uniref:Uncharacterized protein n=1 Tax=Ataeniobius toweri TaxID=208326 RepID=A0ABU7AWM1_9TELE|nr:hypothetical protein [Ataeniobius toweri]
MLLNSHLNASEQTHAKQSHKSYRAQIYAVQLAELPLIPVCISGRGWIPLEQSAHFMWLWRDRAQAANLLEACWFRCWQEQKQKEFTVKLNVQKVYFRENPKKEKRSKDPEDGCERSERGERKEGKKDPPGAVTEGESEGKEGAKERGVMRKLREGRVSISSVRLFRPAQLQKQLLAQAERRENNFTLRPCNYHPV